MPALPPFAHSAAGSLGLTRLACLHPLQITSSKVAANDASGISVNATGALIEDCDVGRIDKLKLPGNMGNGIVLLASGGKVTGTSVVGNRKNGLVSQVASNTWIDNVIHNNEGGDVNVTANPLAPTPEVVVSDLDGKSTTVLASFVATADGAGEVHLYVSSIAACATRSHGSLATSAVKSVEYSAGETVEVSFTLKDVKHVNGVTAVVRSQRLRTPLALMRGKMGDPTPHNTLLVCVVAHGGSPVCHPAEPG